MTAIWASPLDNILLIGTKDNGIKRIDIQTKTYKDILPQQKKSPLYTRNIIRMTKEKTPCSSPVPTVIKSSMPPTGSCF